MISLWDGYVWPTVVIVAQIVAIVVHGEFGWEIKELIHAGLIVR